MTAVLPQFEGLRVEASGALVGAGVVPLPHDLDVLATVGVQEQDHWVVLDVVQPLHCSGSDVQKRVLVLRHRKTGCEGRDVLKCSCFCVTVDRLTFSAILLTVSSLMTVELLSPPLRGTMSAFKNQNVSSGKLRKTFLMLNLPQSQNSPATS